ncbi:MAG: response regulator [Candidatus Geothermincolales bacterium]
MGGDDRAEVLVVDDEPDVARIIAFNLELEGLSVRVAHDGRQALEEVARRKPDCILLDIMMPEVDGWEVLRRLKSDPSTSDIPVIMVTARGSDVDRLKGYSGGAVEYITKPFDLDDLKEQVKRALRPPDPDLEERRRRERIRGLQLSTLHAVTEAIISSLEVEEVLQVVMEKLTELFHLDFCAVVLFNGQGKRVESVFLHSDLSSPGVGERMFLADRANRLTDLFAATVESRPVGFCREELVLNGILSADALPEGVEEVFFVPLKSKERLSGVMCLAARRKTWFSREEEEVLSAVANETAMALENARLLADLRSKEEAHRGLLQRLITAQEEERRRIAAELHDGVIQNMAGALFRLRLFSAQWPDLPQERKEPLREAEELVNRSIGEMRRIISGLRPAMLEEMGLACALEEYVKTLERLGERHPEVELDIRMGEKPDPRVETALFRIAQEALNNALRHSGCQKVRVRVEEEGGCLLMEISDDGTGFDVSGIYRRDGKGFGIIGMRERAESLGGTLTLQSEPGLGTRISVRLPSKPAD